MSGSNPIDTHVGTRLRAKRLKECLIIEQMASRIDISPACLLEYENGTQRIPAAILVRLSRALCVAPTYFFEPLLNGCDHLPASGNGRQRDA
ncbi:helix-turn-helix domain-containing protein [Rhodoblastus sphagnicola]|uniref:helix-turn-helix domain-containing protein n=1 Tax=Rhodoblastus sphagnicola TaxID=333368 RepID=UPI0011B0150C